MTIKEAREAKGLSQAALDTLLRLAPGTVGRWERGVVTPTRRNRARLAKRLGVIPEQRRCEFWLDGDPAEWDSYCGQPATHVRINSVGQSEPYCRVHAPTGSLSLL